MSKTKEAVDDMMTITKQWYNITSNGRFKTGRCIFVGHYRAVIQL